MTDQFFFYPGPVHRSDTPCELCGIGRCDLIITDTNGAHYCHEGCLRALMETRGVSSKAFAVLEERLTAGRNFLKAVQDMGKGMARKLERKFILNVEDVPTHPNARCDIDWYTNRWKGLHTDLNGMIVWPTIDG